MAWNESSCGRHIILSAPGYCELSSDRSVSGSAAADGLSTCVVQPPFANTVFENKSSVRACALLQATYKDMQASYCDVLMVLSQLSYKLSCYFCLLKDKLWVWFKITNAGFYRTS